MFSEPFKLPARTLVSGEKKLNLDRPRLIGILNSTPDSFSDASRFFKLDDALVQARKMIDDGADWLDIGGESSGPDSTNVTMDIELISPIAMEQGLRFAIREGGRTVGAGVVSEVVE